MDSSSIGAFRAYSDALQRLQNVEAGPADDLAGAGQDGGAFADMVKDVVGQAIATSAEAETASMAAAAGQGSLIDVVGAVTNAEVTLQTVVTVRDRIIQAYQDIIKMPI